MESIFRSDNLCFSKIFDHFDLGVLIVAANYQIIYANQWACTILGCEDDDLTGKYFTEEFSESPNIIQSLAQFRNFDPSEKQSGELRKRGLMAIPVTFWLTAFAENFSESDERLFCFQSINDEKKYYNVRGNFSLEKIIASLIHEIRNPLGGIVGFSNLLEQDLSHLKHAHNMILKIKQAAESLEKLLNSLTIISREKSNGNLKPVLSQNYWGRLFLIFQNEIHQKKMQILVEKKFPQNDIFVAINPFTFNVLWDIILHQFEKMLQEKNIIVFEIIQKPGKVCFEINLKSEENATLSLSNGFRIPEIKRLMIEKILDEHQGKFYSFDAKAEKTFVRIELPRFDDGSRSQ